MMDPLSLIFSGPTVRTQEGWSEDLFNSKTLLRKQAGALFTTD